jgi:hypothetical protein
MSKACPKFWTEDPAILWQQATEFFPFTATDQRCTAAALNSLTRFGVYLGILLSVVRLEFAWLLVGVTVAVFAVGAWYWMMSEGVLREQFAAQWPQLTEAPIVDEKAVNGSYVPDIIGSNPQDRTLPSAANPFMNVLLPEIGDNPYRAPAAAVQGNTVRKELDDYFQTMFASDPGDVYQKTQNQRIWVAQPSTTIPNDQAAFADWLFRVPGQTCKEGNQEACTYYGTGSDLLPWRAIQKLT